jgi:SAM-dependent methyltransferase
MHRAEHIRGTRGYSEHAAELIERYEALSFVQKHDVVLPLIPSVPSNALDIGTGTGADAGWLAAQGHRVVAVEPTQALREYGLKHHASPLIEWVDDALPHLDRIACRKSEFRLIMVTAVWMHLDEQERRVAMPVVASLLAPGGMLAMTLRHGAVPVGRIMFAVSAEETIAQAEREGLRCVLNIQAESRLTANREAGVSWSRIVFTRASP